MALRSDIPDLQHRLARDLLLEVQVVVLHIGRLNVAVEPENIALIISKSVVGAYTGLPGTMVPPTAPVERIGAGPMLLYAGPGSKKGAYGKWPSTMSWEKASKKIPYPARITDVPFPVMSQARLNPGSKILVVRVIQLAEPRLPNLRQRKCARPRRRRHASDVAQQVVLLAHDPEVVPAQPVVQRQAAE